MAMSLPMPEQDEHLPDKIEAYVHQAGLEIQRQLFQVLIEKADHELVLQHRHGKGGAGIRAAGNPSLHVQDDLRRGHRPASRISHKHDGTMEVPSAVDWGTSHQLAITENLRDAVCDQMSDHSSGRSLADICQYAGDADLLGRSTIIEIVHQEGESLIAAQRQRARVVLADASETQLAMLGPAVAGSRGLGELADDDPPLDDSRSPGARPSGSRRASPAASRRSRWPGTNPAWWTRGW